jgi:glycine oxidase
VLRELVRAAEAPEWFAAPFGGFEMPHAARLDVPRYLDASRAYFRARGMYHTAEVDSRDSFEAQTVVLCRGFARDADPWFGGIRFNAAKGEMLTIRVPGLRETRTVHCGVWLTPVGPRDLSPAEPGFTAAPLADQLFRVGATYTWEPLDSLPTPEARAEIERKLRAFLKLPFEVIDHRAAVRPVIDAGFPVLGRHPLHPQFAYFNGLGSKGSLLAPFFANQLAAHLCNAGAIEEQVNVARFVVHAPPANG